MRTYQFSETMMSHALPELMGQIKAPENKNTMKIREMQLIIRVAETSSMTLAAQQLHMTPAAVSAAINRIEKSIGIRLFERTTRSLHLTDEGAVILGGCEEVVMQWQQTLDDAKGHRTELEGTVHLSAPADTSYQILQGVVAQLCVEHPKLHVVLNVGDAVHHVHREAIDMAIRYGPLQDSTLTARKLLDSPRILVASPAYLNQNGEPKTLQSLTTHRCLTLHLSNTPTVEWTLHGHNETHTLSIESPLCGDGFLARQWAISGMGIAFKCLFDVIDDLEAGRLIQILPDYIGDRVAIHVLSPSRRFQPTRVKALTHMLMAHFGAREERCQSWLNRT